MSAIVATRFGRRWLQSFALLLVALAGVTAWWRLEVSTLRPHAFTTGGLLLAALVFLAGYNLRKRFPFLPLGSSAAWLQFHIYVGLGTIWIFLLHTSFWVPTGLFEGSLATLYLLVT